MEPFEPKSDFEYPMQKPSFDSVVRQKRREAEQKSEQERYKVATQHISEDVEDEPVYTAIEQKGIVPCRTSFRAAKTIDYNSCSGYCGNLYFLLLCRLIIGNTPKTGWQALLYETY